MAVRLRFVLMVAIVVGIAAFGLRHESHAAPAAVKTPVAATTAAPPNIILIMADDLGYGELGCYGQQKIRTPRIDQLASEGMRFTQFYAGSPLCASSRCVLMTGMHTGHSYVRDNQEKGPWSRIEKEYDTKFSGQRPIPAETITVAELLKQRGYATAAIGKWGLGHIGTTGAPTSQGFDLFYGFYCQRHAHNHYPAYLWRNGEKEPLPGNTGDQPMGDIYSQDRFIENAKAFIASNHDKPFFLYLPVTVPHLAIQAPEEAVDEYSDLPESPYESADSYQKSDRPHAGYAAMVTHLDKGVGQIVDLVEQLELDERTLIIFTSDNGPAYERIGGADSDFFNSSAGLRGRKREVYEGGIRVPLIARWTKTIPAGSESTAPAACWDLLPTLCDAAGVTPPSGIDGVDLMPVLRGEPIAASDRNFYWELANGKQQAVRMGRWKGVRTDLTTADQPWELYDLKADRSETANVAAQHPEIVAKIDRYARASHVDSREYPFAAIDSR